MKSIEKGEVDHAELIQEPSALSEEWKPRQPSHQGVFLYGDDGIQPF